MNNQKDTQRTVINDYGQSNVSNGKSLSNMAVSGFTNKRTEKLITALYLVSDCMESDDAIKGKIRLLGVELLSDIYKYTSLSPVEKSSFVGTPISRIYELLSFIEIAKNIGFVSEMNANILNHEFSKLAVDLRESVNKDRHFTFTLDNKMFELEKEGGDLNGDNNRSRTFNRQENSSLSFRNFNQKSFKDNMSFIGNKASTSQTFNKQSHNQGPLDRQNRTNKIMTLIRDKKDVSIKDISIFLTGYSEKTIQRELNSLVSKGQLKKTGSKRWSRYHLA